MHLFFTYGTSTPAIVTVAVECRRHRDVTDVQLIVILFFLNMLTETKSG